MDACYRNGLLDSFVSVSLAGKNRPCQQADYAADNSNRNAGSNSGRALSLLAGADEELLLSKKSNRLLH